MGFLEGFKDAFDDERTLHLQVTEKQLAFLYDKIPANTKTFGLKLDVPDRVLGTWMDVFCRRTSFHFSYILSNQDVLRTVRDCRDNTDNSFGYLLHIPVDFADIAKMHYNNRVRVESVLKVDMKFRPLRACWRVRGEPKAWKEGAVVEVKVTSKRSEATTSSKSTSSEVTVKQSSPSATTSKPSTPSTATSRDSAPSATTSKQSTRRPPPPPPTSATSTATSSARTALTVSALRSMATLRPEDSVSNVGRWVRATPGGSSTSR